MLLSVSLFLVQAEDVMCPDFDVVQKLVWTEKDKELVFSYKDIGKSIIHFNRFVVFVCFFFPLLQIYIKCYCRNFESFETRNLFPDLENEALEFRHLP